MTTTNRRAFFAQTAKVLSGKEVQSAKRTKRTLTTGLAAYSGAWTSKQVLHLLRRTLFGVKLSELSQFKAMTMSQAVDAILNVGNTLPNPPVNNYNTKNYTDPDVPSGQTWINAAYGATSNIQRRVSFKGWWMENIVKQSPNIREKMTLFWHNHFATEINIIGDAQLLYPHHTLFRQHALGNFKTLVTEVTKNPAMIIYLNGDKNTKTAPDENYARELQELFTMGKGPDSKYTEADVKAAARVLTGWRINRLTGLSFFDSTKHDTTDKTFSSFYNGTVIKGKTGSAGANETDELIDMLFLQDEVAKYISRRIYTYFVYYEIDANTEQNIIAPLANIFRTNNYEIKPVLEALFKSEHFFDEWNMGCYIKNPIDLTAGLVRQFNVSVPEDTLELNYQMFGFLRTAASLQLLDLGDPPNVAGWPAYYQLPQFYELWINSDTLPKRNQTSDVMISKTGYKYSGKTLNIDALAFTNSLKNPVDINDLIDEVVEFLYCSTISTTQRNYLKSILLSGQTQDYYWSDAWNLYKTNPGNTANTDYVNNVLRAMYKYLMNLAEYQLI